MRDTRTSPPDEEEYRWGCADDCELCEPKGENKPMKVYLDSNPDDAPCCIKLVAEDGRDILVQTDLDYPSIASNLGFSLASVQAIEGPPCDHDGTDGTIDCKSCGATAGDFISAAQAFIDDHDGESFDDPGYFSED